MEYVDFIISMSITGSAIIHYKWLLKRFPHVSQQFVWLNTKQNRVIWKRANEQGMWQSYGNCSEWKKLYIQSSSVVFSISTCPLWFQKLKFLGSILQPPRPPPSHDHHPARNITYTIPDAYNLELSITWSFKLWTRSVVQNCDSS